LRKFTSILLVTLIFTGSLFPKTGIEELHKIPQLIIHYQDHLKTENNSFNFFSFLIKHYASDHAQNGHAHQGHPSLPSMHSGAPIFAFIVPFYSLNFMANFVSTLFSQKINFYHTIYSFIYTSSLLQPPKF